MVADTYSDTLGYLVMGTGNDNNSWGSNANSAVFEIFEDAIANALSSAVTGGTLDLSASPPPAAASGARYAALIFTGILASNQVVQVPNLTKWWWVKNATSGAYTLKFKTSGGSASTAIPQNSGWQLVYCDGADAIVVAPFNTKQIQMPDGTEALPAYSNITEPSSGWYRAGTEDWRLSINGADVLQVTGTGASTPSIVNVLSPNALQIDGAQWIPAGAEQDGAFVELPSGGWLWADGTAYSRSTYSALFAAITKAATGTTNSSTSITSASADLRFKGLVGAYIEGTGIPTGTTITAIAATTITLSQAATSSGAGVSLRILPFGQGDASTTFNVPDRRGRVRAGRDDMGGTSANRLTGLTGGLNGDNLNATGGAETHTLTIAQSAAHDHGGNTGAGTPHTHSVAVGSNQGALSGSGSAAGGAGPITSGSESSHTHSISSQGGGGAHNNVQPTGISNVIIKT